MIVQHPASLFEVEAPDTARIIAMLLAARAASSGAGNRRALFARMDDLLGQDSDGFPPGALAAGEASVASAPADDSGRVRLTRLRLRNWKSFESADIALPDKGGDHPLVVIGGPNGFGKSSILEAFLLGLFGRRAISDMGQFVSGTSGRGGARRSYRSILQRSLHRSPRAAADGTCSVTLDFATASGPVQVERRWYFDERGEPIEEDEEVVVRAGEDRSLLRAPEGVAARDWQQTEIERLVMPAGLAPFFVFDGEQIERRADRHLADQVRSALSRLLGLDDLAGLASDLRDYARDRERGYAETEARTIDHLREAVDQGAAELTAAEDALSKADVALGDLRIERDRALATLSATEPASHRQLQCDLEAEHRLLAERRQLDRELAAAICEEGPLLLAGATLLEAAADGLQEVGRLQAVALDEGEIDVLWDRFANFEPVLDPATAVTLRARFFAACGGVDDAEEPAINTAVLGRAARRAVVSRLRGAAETGRVRLEVASRAMAANGAHLQALRVAAANAGEVAAAREAAQIEFARISEAVATAEERRTSAVGLVATLRQSVDPMREDLGRREALLRDAEPRLRAAAAARLIASSLDAHATEIANAEHAKFAAAVTARFREMAHKDQIDRIDISSDGGVTLIDARGRDISDYPLSAGESQLFAMALVAAVGDLAGDRLPLIVDTPLGRLDSGHRKNVMDMLSRRRAQTILLTQPEEISDARLAELRPVLAMSAELRHSVDPDTGVGVSRIAPAAVTAAMA